MTDEERQRAIDFIVEQQAKNVVEIDKLIESHRQAEHRFDRDERVLTLMIRAGRRARDHMREQDMRFAGQIGIVTEKLAELAEAQVRTEASIAHTDSRLDALVDIVRRQHNGGKNSLDKKESG
jgi:hypothetical protein